MRILGLIMLSLSVCASGFTQEKPKSPTTVSEAAAMFDHPGCQKYYTYLQLDPAIPGGVMVNMSTTQVKWLWKAGVKKYPTVCLSGKKATYLLVWSSQTITSTYQTLERVYSSSQITLDNGTTGTAESYDTPVVTTGTRNTEVTHMFVYSYKDGKLSRMPIARFDHQGRWLWSKPTKDDLEDALRFLSSYVEPQ